METLELPLSTVGGVAPLFSIPTPSTSNPAMVFLETMGNQNSRATMRYTLNRVAAIIDPTLAGKDGWRVIPWAQLTASIVRGIMAKVSGSPATRNKILAAIKGVARAAWELRMLSSDDLERIRAIKGDKGSREIAGRFVPLGEITALLRVCAEDGTAAGARDAAMISIAAATGARRAEIAGIEAASVRQPEPCRYELRIIGKGNKERTLFICGNAALALSDWLAIREFAPGCNSNGPLFCAIRKGGTILPGAGLTTTALDKLLRKRCRQAQVPHLNWHDLRRTTTSNLLDAGADIATVAGILGHANVQTTARYDRRGERAKLRASELILVPYFLRK